MAADILLNPSFPDAELGALQDAPEGAARADADDAAVPGHGAGRRDYGNHPNSRLMPTVESIDKTTRDALVAFDRAHYAPDQA